MPTPRSIITLWLILLLASATIATAWFFQLVLGYIPCKLCLEQRIPYYIGIPVCIIALTMMARGASFYVARSALVCLALIFAVSAGLGAYHAGVEWGFWLGPAECGGAAPALPTKANDLMGAINASSVVSCTQAAWRLFGISMAGWNAVVSVFMVGIALRGTKINT